MGGMIPPYTPNHDAPSEGTWNKTQDGPVWTQDHATLVSNAVYQWKGNALDFMLHVKDERSGAPYPSSGTGKVMREQTRALLWELQHASRKTPTLFRGSHRVPTGIVPWSSSRKVADFWAAKNGGRVFELPPGRKGLRVADYISSDPEKEWIVLDDAPFT